MLWQEEEALADVLEYQLFKSPNTGLIRVSQSVKKATVWWKCQTSNTYQNEYEGLAILTPVLLNCLRRLLGAAISDSFHEDTEWIQSPGCRSAYRTADRQPPKCDYSLAKRRRRASQFYLCSCVLKTAPCIWNYMWSGQTGRTATWKGF